MPKPPEEKKPNETAYEDFATRLGRHLGGATDPDTIAEPAKPEADKKPAEKKKPAADKPKIEDELKTLGSGMAIGDIVANAPKPADKPNDGKVDGADGAKDKKPPKKDEAQPAGDKKPEGEKAADDQPEGEKKVSEKKKVVVERREAKPVAAAAPVVRDAEKAAAEPEDDAKKEQTLDELVGSKLSDDERDYLELVRYAEKKDGKFSGALSREVERMKAMTEFARNWRKERPGSPIDVNDEGYKALIAEHPATLSKADVKRLDRERMRDELQAETDKKLATEKAKIDAKLREVEVAPRVEKQITADVAAFESALPEDEDLKGVLDKKGIEGRLARQARDRASEHVRAYRRIAEGLDPLDMANPVHKGIVGLMDAAGDYFKAHGGPNGKADLVRDGKRFVTRREFAALARAGSPEVEKVWTIGHDEMANIILGNHVAQLKKEITDLRRDLAEDGYTSGQSKPDGGEKKPEAADDTEEDEDEKASPRSGSSPSASGAASPKDSKPRLSRFERMLVADPNGAD